MINIKAFKQCAAVLLLLLTAFTPRLYAAEPPKPDAALDSILGVYASKRDLTEWEAVVLGVNGVKIKTPLFSTPFFRRMDKEVADKKGEYRLVTDYTRVALTYVSHGKDPSSISGYDFIEKIVNFPNISNQGVNGYIWSLIALYGREAAVTRPFIDNILCYQTPSGAFTYTRAPDETARPDADITAMAVTALSAYMSDETAGAAVSAAVEYLSLSQGADGAYSAYNAVNCETTAQVIIALCSAGVDLSDVRFIKNGNTLLDALNRFKVSGAGYAHLSDGKTADPIATRQAALALSAYRKAERYNAMTAEERAGASRGIFEFLP